MVSRPATTIDSIGKTSRGQYTLFSTGTFVTRLRPPVFKLLEKNVQGSKPR